MGAHPRERSSARLGMDRRPHRPARGHAPQAHHLDHRQQRIHPERVAGLPVLAVLPAAWTRRIGRAEVQRSEARGHAPSRGPLLPPEPRARCDAPGQGSFARAPPDRVPGSALPTGVAKCHPGALAGARSAAAGSAAPGSAASAHSGRSVALPSQIRPKAAPAAQTPRIVTFYTGFDYLHSDPSQKAATHGRVHSPPPHAKTSRRSALRSCLTTIPDPRLQIPDFRSQISDPNTTPSGLIAGTAAFAPTTASASPRLARHKRVDDAWTTHGRRTDAITSGRPLASRTQAAG